MNKSLWTGVIALLVISFGLIFLGSRMSNSVVSVDSESLLSNAVSASDHVKGATGTSTKVTLVEYSDFECPACGAYAPVVKQLAADYADQMSFVYRHFPLPQHLGARPAAHAAEAAGKQGKFFEMHDLIFARKNEWSTARSYEDTFKQYATELGLDVAQFEADMKSDAVAEKVEIDRQSGNKSGVRGTPTFFLNGKQIANPQTYEAFKALIDDAINNS